MKIAKHSELNYHIFFYVTVTLQHVCQCHSFEIIIKKASSVSYLNYTFGSQETVDKTIALNDLLTLYS